MLHDAGRNDTVGSEGPAKPRFNGRNSEQPHQAANPLSFQAETKPTGPPFARTNNVAQTADLLLSVVRSVRTSALAFGFIHKSHPIDLMRIHRRCCTNTVQTRLDGPQGNRKANRASKPHRNMP